MSLRDVVEEIFPEWERWYPSLFDAAADLGVIRARVCPPSQLLLSNRHAGVPRRGDPRLPRTLERDRGRGARLPVVAQAGADHAPVATVLACEQQVEAVDVPREIPARVVAGRAAEHADGDRDPRLFRALDSIESMRVIRLSEGCITR